MEYRKGVRAAGAVVPPCGPGNCHPPGMTQAEGMVPSCGLPRTAIAAVVRKRQTRPNRGTFCRHVTGALRTTEVMRSEERRRSRSRLVLTCRADPGMERGICGRIREIQMEACGQ